MALMCDQKKFDNNGFAQRLAELRKTRWNEYKKNLNMQISPYEKYAYCRTQETFAEALNVERRTISKWESGTTIPTIDKVYELCHLLNCNIDYLLGNESLVGLSPSVIASHYSGISIEIINYAKNNSDYLDCLNYFMHPDNCSLLFNDITLTTWKIFLSNNELDNISDPLKSLIIDIFQNYQTFTPINSYNKESYKQYLRSSLPENKISFSQKKSDDCICVKSCISSIQFNKLNLSKDNPENYHIFIDYIADYSYEILINKMLLNIQKENLSKSFIHIFEKYLSD